MQNITPEEYQQFREDYRQMVADLEHFHGLFYALGSAGVPTLTDQIDTACVTFDSKQGHFIQFMWNYEFWKECDQYTRMFVACHEMLHIMYNHGTRMHKGKEVNPQAVNATLDVVVNETLINYFGFIKELIKIKTKKEDKDGKVIVTDDPSGICWIDTVFPDDPDVKEDEAYEYYYNRLKDQSDPQGTPMYIVIDGGGMPEDGKSNDGKGNVIVVDDHSMLPSKDMEKLKDAIQKAIDHELSDQEKRDFVEKAFGQNDDKSTPENPTKEDSTQEKELLTKSAGTMAGETCYTIIRKLPKYSMKWTTVITNWRKRKGHEEGPEDVWHTTKRRFFLLPKSLSLPSEFEEEEGEKEYIDAWFFQDISGSCVHMAQKFLDAARTFPPNKFKVRAFTFDTIVREIDLKTATIRGGGGTAFVPIEEKIQELVAKEKCKYPDAVFVFTDGYSWDRIQPQYPKQWYWFLDDYSTEETIPKACNIYYLKDFYKI